MPYSADYSCMHNSFSDSFLIICCILPSLFVVSLCCCKVNVVVLVVVLVAGGVENGNENGKEKTRNPLIQRAPGCGADSQIRTGDLILTNYGRCLLRLLVAYCILFPVFRQCQSFQRLGLFSFSWLLVSSLLFSCSKIRPVVVLVVVSVRHPLRPLLCKACGNDLIIYRAELVQAAPGILAYCSRFYVSERNKKVLCVSLGLHAGAETPYFR